MKPELRVVVDRWTVNTTGTPPTKSMDLRAFGSEATKDACAIMLTTVAILGFQNNPTLMFDPIGLFRTTLDNPPFSKYYSLISLSPKGGYIDVYTYFNAKKCKCVCGEMCAEFLSLGGIGSFGTAVPPGWMLSLKDMLEFGTP